MRSPRPMHLVLAALVLGLFAGSGELLARGGGTSGGGGGGGGGGGRGGSSRGSGGGAGGSLRAAKRNVDSKKKDLEANREKTRQIDYRDRDAGGDRQV